MESTMKFRRNDARQTEGFLRATVVVLALALPPVAAAPSPALAQAVQLVKVDVAVVGKGLRASKLIGQSVVNDKNEKVGSVDDIIVGSDHSLFAVLQVGGFLGIGKKLVAVPYDSLKLDEKDGKVAKVELPGASSDQLKQLAEFRYPT
jgi:sporulation protein YlmC with PRC-barrel domain